MNYSGYTNDYYQQQQQQQPYEYDASQIQTYDQSYSYQPYYAYNQQYAYYPDATQTHLQFQPESIPVHPPGVTPTAPEPVPAIAPTGPSSQYRGRGGRPFRGGGRGRGQFNSRGRGRHNHSHSSGPTISIVPGAPSSSFSEQVQVAPLKQPPRSFVCEICKVECNSPEILEQHKNGKKHKKTMKAHEELQRRNAIYEQQSGQVPNITDQPKVVQESDKRECSTENMGHEIAVDNNKEETELQDNAGKTTEAPAEEPEGKTRGTSARRGRGLKRKMRGGRGGKLKYARTADGSRPVELPKPAQAASFVCEVCNVKCESNVVYQSHLTGKKHLTNLKRVHGNQALSGVGNQIFAGLGLQAVYPPDVNALLSTINTQVQQGDNDPQVLLAQLLMTVLSQAQVQGVTPPTGSTAAQIPAPTSEAGPSHQPQLSQTQASEIDLGNSETKQEELKPPQASSVMAPADN